MRLDSITTTVTAVWLAAVCTAAIAGNLRWLVDCAVLAGLAILPPLVTMWQWDARRPAMSLSIQEALR